MNHTLALQTALALPTARARVISVLALDYTSPVGRGAPAIRALAEKFRAFHRRERAARDREKVRVADRERATASVEARDRRRAIVSGDARVAEAIANAHHRQISASWTRSKRAVIEYGRGGRVVCGERRGSRYAPPSWRNAGVRIDYTLGVCICENSSGKEVARIALPRDFKRIRLQGLLSGDAYAISHVGGWHTRHLPSGEVSGYTAWDNESRVCGHGDTLARAKRDLARIMAGLPVVGLSDFANRIARACPSLVCTLADARAAGFCAAGIRQFQREFSVEGSATAAALRETKNEYIPRLIAVAASRVAAARIAKKRGCGEGA